MSWSYSWIISIAAEHSEFLWVSMFTEWFQLSGNWATKMHLNSSKCTNTTLEVWYVPFFDYISLPQLFFPLCFSSHSCAKPHRSSLTPSTHLQHWTVWVSASGGSFTHPDETQLMICQRIDFFLPLLSLMKWLLCRDSKLSQHRVTILQKVKQPFIITGVIALQAVVARLGKLIFFSNAFSCHQTVWVHCAISHFFSLHASRIPVPVVFLFF